MQLKTVTRKLKILFTLRSLSILPLGLLFSFTMMAQAQQPFRHTSVAAEYRVRPDDVLDIYVVDVPEVSRQCRVSADGYVSIPLLSEELPATGKGLAELAENVASRLREKGMVSDPHVTVTVAHSRLSAVSITGAVHKPQIYPIFGKTTLVDVLSQAEGLEPEAGDSILIQREPEPSDQDLGNRLASRPIEVNVSRLLNGENHANVVVFPGDRITVPRAGVVYVVGAVNKPGGFQLGLNRQRLSLLQALALAEDFKSTALKSKALLIRADASAPQGRSEKLIDLNQVLNGKAADVPMQAEDILFVPDSSTRKLLKRGTEAVLQVATGVAIYGRY